MLQKVCIDFSSVHSSVQFLYHLLRVLLCCRPQSNNNDCEISKLLNKFSQIPWEDQERLSYNEFKANSAASMYTSEKA